MSIKFFYFKKKKQEWKHNSAFNGQLIFEGVYLNKFCPIPRTIRQLLLEGYTKKSQIITYIVSYGISYTIDKKRTRNY